MATGNLGLVVIAVDGSEESMNALRWALTNLRLRPPSDSNPGGEFLVLHVQSPPSIATSLNPGAIPFGGPSYLEVPAFTAAIEAHQRRITDAILKHALNICEEMHVSVKTQVMVGDPKEQICEMVDKLHADLLVMGCRAFGPIKRMFLGSVSNYCINHVSCPVVVIKVCFTQVVFFVHSEEALLVDIHMLFLSLGIRSFKLGSLRLRPPSDSKSGGEFLVLHVQSPLPPSPPALTPSPSPFGGPSNLEVPAFTAVIEAHQRRFTDAIFKHALKICEEMQFCSRISVVLE
ncbi:hypothetical protein J5N97_003080 [Dioscorea zingiberensis]|uniref:UspA domain-containing protein n=1 Tax=Dioscorea zingiberensis TaxID=325984 RepID=A0A9D5HQ09_9LILI|nr:hypothetical protein J5N97_003080 [Dioscorea zingiberensis]